MQRSPQTRLETGQDRGVRPSSGERRPAFKGKDQHTPLEGRTPLQVATRSPNKETCSGRVLAVAPGLLSQTIHLWNSYSYFGYITYYIQHIIES